MNGFSFGLDSGGLTINGGRSQDSLITFDGAVGIRTRANGTSIGTADLDTVQEVQVLTANYSAEYGRSSAGQIRMVTKSGGKEFHGTLYEYFRNSQLDANSWARNRSAATNFVAPVPFQPVRLQRQRPGDDSEGLQTRPREAVLPVQPGVGPLP